MLTLDVAAVAAIAAVATVAVRQGAAGVFATVLGFLLLAFGLVRQQLPSSRPLSLDDEGVTIRVVGAGLRVHWDAIEGMDARLPRRPPNRRAGMPPARLAVTFRLRPGAGAQGLVRPLGWRSGWLLWQDSVTLRRVPPQTAEEILSLAGQLHRKRLAETARLSPALPTVPRYPG